MSITVWTQEGCGLCEQVKEALGSGSYEERPADELISGVDRNIDAMVQLSMQNMELPLVQIDGTWVSPHEVIREQCVA